MPEQPAQPLKVVIVAASLRILGGQAVQAQRLVEGWSGDPEVNARLLPINPVPPAPFDRLLRIKYLRTIVTQLWYWPLLLRELRRAELVHIFSASYFSFLLAPLPAVIVGKLYGLPVLVNYHSGEAPDHLARSRTARAVLRKWADLVVVPSRFLRDVFESFGIHAAVVPNTVDLTRFRYRVRDPLQPRLLSTRNFESVYNVACTLRAFAHVQERYPDASLTLVGGGSEEASLRRLAIQLGLRHVTFTGAINPTDISSYYQNADIYVQTPSVDNMPLSVLEAFASGLPVVSTSVGGVPAILKDGVDGVLAPEGDAAAVAFQVMRLLERPAFARKLAAAAYESCSAYQWATARDGWLRAYDLASHTASAQRDESSAPKLAANGRDTRAPAAGSR